MRTLGSLILACLLPVSAFADAGVTAVDDEPVSHAVAAGPAAAAHDPDVQAAAARPTERHAPADVGQLRTARVAAPDPVDVDDGPGVAREHAVTEPHEVTTAATDSDMMAELAARQLRRETKRHQRLIDGCLAAAHKRAPAAAGTLTLDFDVANRKLKTVRVSDDSVHDLQLAGCLTSAARGFSFSLATAHFRWPVAVR